MWALRPSRAGRLPADLATDLADALHFLMGLRLKAGLEEMETGRPVSGGVQLDRLAFERLVFRKLPRAERIFAGDRQTRTFLLAHAARDRRAGAHGEFSAKPDSPPGSPALARPGLIKFQVPGSKFQVRLF